MAGGNREGQEHEDLLERMKIKNKRTMADEDITKEEWSEHFKNQYVI